MADIKTAMELLALGIHSQSTIASSCGCSKRDVSKYAKLIKERRWTTEDIEKLTVEDIAELFPRKKRSFSEGKLEPDYEVYLERKLKHRKFTYKFFYREYEQEAYELGLLPISYASFCSNMDSLVKVKDVVAKLHYDPGCVCMIDWTGDHAYVHEAGTKEPTEASIFAAILPYSNYFFTKAYYTEKRDAWLCAHMDAFEYFGGVPHLLIPDNCSTAVDRAPIHEAKKINKYYRDLAEHYGCGIHPTRAYSPRDKGLVESIVNVIERDILAPASERTFKSLEALNNFS